MAFAIKVQIEGMEALQNKLRALAPASQRRVLRPALQKEGTRILQRARQNVPVQTKMLRRSLGQKTRTYPNGGVIVVVGPRRGFRQVIAGKPRNPTKYAHLVEFGTRPHSIATRVGGRKVYGRKRRNYTTVMHPGSKGQKPLTRAYQTALVGAAVRMANQMAKDIERLASQDKLKLAK